MTAAEGVRAADLLQQLIAIKTHQPGPDGVGGAEKKLCEHLVPLILPHRPDEIAIVDAPRGAGGSGAYLFARWGTPDRVINAHIDTVPPNTGWSRDPWTPMTPFNGTSDEMKAVGGYLRKHGVYAMIANNSIHTNPPLCITEDELAYGFEVLDAALDIADQAVTA